MSVCIDNARLIQALRLYAEAERNNTAIDTLELGPLLGISRAAGFEVRLALFDCGWLEVVTPSRGGRPATVWVADDGYVALEEAADTAPPSEPAALPCLRCRRPFASEWIGNRICTRCKASNDWRACA